MDILSTDSSSSTAEDLEFQACCFSEVDQRSDLNNVHSAQMLKDGGFRNRIPTDENVLVFLWYF